MAQTGPYESVLALLSCFSWVFFIGLSADMHDVSKQVPNHMSRELDVSYHWIRIRQQNNTCVNSSCDSVVWRIKFDHKGWLQSCSFEQSSSHWVTSSSLRSSVRTEECRCRTDSGFFDRLQREYKTSVTFLPLTGTHCSSWDHTPTLQHQKLQTSCVCVNFLLLFNWDNFDQKWWLQHFDSHTQNTGPTVQAPLLWKGLETLWCQETPGSIACTPQQEFFPSWMLDVRQRLGCWRKESGATWHDPNFAKKRVLFCERAHPSRKEGSRPAHAVNLNRTTPLSTPASGNVLLNPNKK